MSRLPTTIPKRPQLKPAEDYYRLRREGIGHIEQMGSALWTDYNTHDPGVTILEALCYALTDLAYRTGWDIQDLLAPATPSADPTHPFPRQPFFTAREILPVNPWTPDDLRRLLIDLDTIRNAWVFCKTCACDVCYYAWCEKDQLVLSYQKPTNPLLQAKKVEPLGFYEVLLEFESDPELGDLNDRKLEHSYNLFDSDGKPHSVILELRFPDWGLGAGDQRDLFVNSDRAFTGENGASFQLTVSHLGATKAYNVLTDPTLDEAARNAYLQKHWRNVFYVSFEISLSLPDKPDKPDKKKIVISHAALRIFSDAFAKSQGSVAGLKAILEDRTTAGFIQRYRRKLRRVDQVVTSAKVRLQAHRNLDEDYCRIAGIEVDDVAACADVEVLPDADIELVQAKIWFEIEQYFNPPVPFYALQELMDGSMPVEDIFNGPVMTNGLLKADDLERAQLKTELRTSDIINRLMDIKGVVAVNNLLLTKYDAEGNIVKGAADPTWQAGVPIFDSSKASASWLMVIGDRHQPRLYHNQSRFLFYKKGLPFLPRKDEAYDTLVQLRGEAERPKLQGTAEDLPIPAGTFRHPEDYAPVQYGFPLTYGIGREGLPSHASASRRAQAKQMKAYLMVFEQFLGNAFAQIANTAKLFSLDPKVDRTYFVKEFNEAMIQGYAELVDSSFNTDELERMAETLTEFHERRNRFLDHIMARFGEQFSEYALLLTNLQGKQVALDRLIVDKISFVNAYPLISRNRGKAFDYSQAPCSPGNIPGLKKRVSLLLGYPDLVFVWKAQSSPDAPGYIVTLRLEGQGNDVWLVREPSIAVANALEAFVNASRLKDKPGNWEIVYETGELFLEQKDPTGKVSIQVLCISEKMAEAQMLMNEVVRAFREMIVQLVQRQNYMITPNGDTFRVAVKDKNGALLCKHGEGFKTEAEAKAFQEELMGWSSNERAIVVEHILLRPKFPGDALFPACTDGPCQTCGDEDPYSFRLTVVMPGWTAPFNVNLEMRDFADRTIRQETPAHLLAKVCWVGNDGFTENPCDPVIGDLADLLIEKGRTSVGKTLMEADSCRCALALYRTFSLAFQRWYEDKTVEYLHADAVMQRLADEFRSKVTPTGLDCPAVMDKALWAEVQSIMVNHFHRIALHGRQFDRFEQAWCNWLEVNANFDWSEERVIERVEAILRSQMVTGPGMKTPDPDELCHCAASIVTKYGAAFYRWMEKGIRDGNPLEEFNPFDPDPITLCPGLSFKPGTDAVIGEFLKDRYDAEKKVSYKDVSYRLWIVVDLLAKLRSTYPGATLHDCGDGSDENPVRLGKTALGQYPLRRTLSPSDHPEVIRGVVSPRERPQAPNRLEPTGKRGKQAKPVKPTSKNKRKRKS